jgi:ADA HAT complex component 1
MFRFWTSDSRGSGKTVDGHHQLLDCDNSVAHSRSGLPTPISPKRRRPSLVDTAACAYPPAKRPKTEQDGDLPSPVSASADGDEMGALCGPSIAPDLDAAREAIEMQFGLEILLKHDELRLINQELAKCQVALEQLRRCHLIPYPLQCPTPSQMLHISNGSGPALGSKRGEPVPKWAPPFGVVEGPYARHYAKWLIPDPVFDGIQCEPQGLMDTGRVKNTAEGRATRSSVSDAAGSGKQRPVRGTAGQRLQALSSGYPQPKDKNSPCTVTKADGVVVKLICIDCQRWDFSSTQGFINHCRIAHRRDFKSHEEAAIASGHPIEVDERGAIVGDDHKPPAAAPSGLVHPLAHSESTLEHREYATLLSRIQASLVLYKAGKLPGVGSVPSLPSSPRDSASTSSQSFVGSSDVPYLSQLMQRKKMGGNLKQQVTEAKTKVDWNWPSPDVDSETDSAPATEDSATREQPLASAVRTPAAMRMPSRAAVSPSHPPAAYRAASNKGLRTTHGTNLESPKLPETPMYDDEMGVDLSPNTVTSNHAPSLVSDDGEYDDSDDGSGSDTSDAMETDSVSDVAEININDEGDAREPTPPPVPRRHGSTSKAAKLKKDESRHVTFVSPTPVPTNNNKGKRKKN